MLCVLHLLNADSSTSKIWLRVNQSVTVGRRAGAGLEIDDPHMSRSHFVVEGTGNGFRVRDLESRNGTWLNGDQVAVAPLRGGDRIVAGASHLLVAITEFGPVDDESGPTSFHGSTADLSREVSAEPRWGSATRQGSDVGAARASGSFSTAYSALGKGAPKGSYATGTICMGNDAQTIDFRESVPPVPEGLEEFLLRPLPELAPGRGLLVGGGTKVMSDLCRRLGRYYRLVFVINREQLDADSRALIDYHLEKGDIEPLSQTIIRIDGDEHAGLGARLFRRATRKDAAVCLGFRYSDGEVDATLRHVTHLLCFPSILAPHVNRAKPSLGIDTIDQSETRFGPDPFFSKVVFALFEFDAEARLAFFSEPGFRLSGTLVA